MTKVFIDGSAGTTGLRIHERLADRKELEILSLPPELRKDRAAREEIHRFIFSSSIGWNWGDYSSSWFFSLNSVSTNWGLWSETHLMDQKAPNSRSLLPL